MESKTTCHEWIAELSGEVEFPYTLSLAFGRCRIDLRTNSAALENELAEYFKPFMCIPNGSQAEITVTAMETEPVQIPFPLTVKQPDPGKTKIKEEYHDFSDGRAVHKRLTSMLFFFNESENLAIGPCLANSNQVINFVNNRFIGWMLVRGSLLGHAAAVKKNGRGLAVAGFSGMGKSTLALHLMSRGTTFVSNDRLLVHAHPGRLTMEGVAKLPRINPGTALNNPDLGTILSSEDRERFSALKMEELWHLEHKYDVPIESCFGPGRFELESPMHGLVLLNWKHDRTPMRAGLVNPAERRDLLPAFMKSAGLFFLPGDRADRLDFSEEAYIELLKECTVLELSGGVDFDAAADICLQFLDTGNLPGSVQR
jgi:HprK-related kinase B